MTYDGIFNASDLSSLTRDSMQTNVKLAICAFIFKDFPKFIDIDEQSIETDK